MFSRDVIADPPAGSAAVSKILMWRYEKAALSVITLAALAAMGFGAYGFIQGRFINSIKIATLASGGVLLFVVITRLVYTSLCNQLKPLKQSGEIELPTPSPQVDLPAERDAGVDVDEGLGESAPPRPQALLVGVDKLRESPRGPNIFQEEAPPLPQPFVPIDRADCSFLPVVLKNCGTTINWFTGTSSATLVGVVKCASSFGEPALAPTGLLLQMRIVPLTGELSVGISDNPSAVNHNNLSGVMWPAVKIASNYARSASTCYAMNPLAELEYITLFMQYRTQTVRTEIALRRLSLCATPPGVDRQKIAQDLESIIEEPERVENWADYLGWVGEELPSNVNTKACTNPLALGQLVVVKRSSGKFCYGIVMSVVKYSDQKETTYTIMVESQSQGFHYYRGLSQIRLPDAFLEKKAASDQVEKEISSLIFWTKRFREAIETFKNPPPLKEQHPFESKPFPIVIGARIDSSRFVKVQSNCKEVAVRGSVLFRDVGVIFAPDDQHHQVQAWLQEYNLAIPVLSLSHLANSS